jgi:hypothetical protein
VTLETPFVSAGMRGSPRLRYFPSRLSLVPHLLTGSLPPDIVLVHTSTPVDGTVSLGTEVNILPAAPEATRARGGIVVAQLNPRMPYTYGDAVLACDEVAYAIEADEPLASPTAERDEQLAVEIGYHVRQWCGGLPSHREIDEERQQVRVPVEMRDDVVADVLLADGGETLDVLAHLVERGTGPWMPADRGRYQQYRQVLVGEPVRHLPSDGQLGE